MKIGSLVECIDDNFFNSILEDVNYGYENMYPVKGGIYTIRDIPEGHGLLLEEIVNPKYTYTDQTTGMSGTYEKAFWIDRFRELMPPMSLSHVLNKHQFEPLKKYTVS